MTILQAQQRLHEKWMELTKDGTDEEMMQSLCIADTVLGNYDESLKADMMAMLKKLEYEIYHALCHEIHGKENCPCTNQTTSCLATFRVCDADRAIGKVIQQKINKLKENENGNK